MRQQGSGAIVNCSSLGGLVALSGRAAYHASKHGVLGLTSSAALEYAPRGIRINAICPGTFGTPMVTAMIVSGELDPAEALANQPIGRPGRADEIASTVLWLCSPAFVPADPPPGEFDDRCRVEEVAFLPPASQGDDRAGLIQDREVLADRLAGHVETGAQLAQGLPVAGVQAVEQVTAADTARARNTASSSCTSAIYATSRLPVNV